METEKSTTGGAAVGTKETEGVATSMEEIKRLGVGKCCSRAHDAMEQYADNLLEDVSVYEDNYRSISDCHKRLVPGFLTRMSEVRKRVKTNNDFMKKILAFHRANYVALARKESSEDLDECCYECCGLTPKDRGRRAHSTQQSTTENLFKQFYREWSAEGVAERRECFQPALDMCLKYLPPLEGNTLRVLAPGAGLGRLSWDLASVGYSRVDACECNHEMLLCMQYMLGSLLAQGSVELYPFVSVTSDLRDDMQMFRASVPDVPITEEVRKRVVISPEDFVSHCEALPSRDGTYDLLVTCFFIDTAYDFLDYVEAATDAIRPGGLWINIGPVHWVQSSYDAIHYTIEEIEGAMTTAGFTFLEKKDLQNCHYCSPPNTFIPMVYNCRLWVARLDN